MELVKVNFIAQYEQVHENLIELLQQTIMFIVKFKK